MNTMGKQEMNDMKIETIGVNNCNEVVENDVNITTRKVFTIECKDIILREFQLEDLDAIYMLTLQKEITEFFPDWIATKEKRREWLMKYELKENNEFIESVPNVLNIKRHTLRLGIILRETNELIGWISSGLKDELPPPNRLKW